MNFTSFFIKELDIHEFCRLFGYNIPVYKEAAYYIGKLAQSKEFEDIYRNVAAMDSFQTSLPEDISPKKFKLDLRDSIVKKLTELGIPKKLNEIDLNGHSFKTQKPQYEPGYYYVSLDLNQANWNVYKTFGGLDTDLNWKEWLKQEFNAPTAIIESKVFRQIVFGELNPGRVSKLQERVTNDNLQQALKAQARGEHEGVVGVSSDEIILKFKEEELMFDKDPVSFINSILPRKFKIFSVEYKEAFGAGIRIDTIYEPFTLQPKYKALREVPGNIFWVYFKTEILGEELEERDLLFKNENRIAKWVLDGNFK